MTAKRKGRSRSDAGTTVLGAMRIDSRLYDELRQEAESSGRSITAQAETRLAERPNEIARLIGLVIDAVERRADKTWSEDEAVRIECIAAASTILGLVLGPSEIGEAVQNAINKHIDALSKTAAGQVRAGRGSDKAGASRKEAQRAAWELQATSDGLCVADEAYNNGIPD